MKLPPLILIPIAAIALAGCGGAAKTVTVTRTVTAAASASRSTSTSTSSTTTTTTSAPPSSSSTTTSSTTATASSSVSTTRTETGPAFVTTNPNSESAAGPQLAAAIAVMARQGYVPVETTSYSTADTLRVLIGRRPGAGAAPAELAFFFDQSRYLGTDAARPSARVTVVSHLDAEVVLSYAIYKPGAGTPSGQRFVHFALDMGQITHPDAIPSTSERR